MPKSPPSLVLASSSPKRKEILTSLGLRFRVHNPKMEEIATAPSPTVLVKENSRLKVRATTQTYPECFIIGADTIVTSGKRGEERIFLKPKNFQEGLTMLRSYRKCPNYVYTGLTVYEPAKKSLITRVQKTRFYLTDMSPRRQKALYRLIYSPHQSGGFSIEGLGSILLDKISGSYYNVLGLPVYLLDKIFLEAGSDILRFAKK